MFHYDDGLFLTAARLGVDVPRRQQRAFISHAHADHIAPHEVSYCTPATARFFRHRRGDRQTIEMPYGQKRQAGPLTLTALPAGHILGSAMLHASDGHQSLLYTGDFRLRPSLTAAAAMPPQADILVMECTFGRPRYRFPSRESVQAELLSLVERIVEEGRTPVVHAYVLGKAQEVTRLLCDDGWSVRQHPLVYEISRLYEQLGCRLGPFQEYRGEIGPREILIFPPPTQRTRWMPLPARRRTIAVSGWALDADYRQRAGVHYALPFSDHADFDELLECAERVRPRVIYCTHGPESFVQSLRDAGHEAYFLGKR